MYELFEGAKSIKTVTPKRDKEFFKRAVKELGFTLDIDLVTFCVAIALYKEHKDQTLDKKQLLYSKKLVGMESFDKRDLYDLIVLEYLDIKEKRLREFETYFYTGFHILKDWFEDNAADTKNELERFSSIWDYLNVGDDSNE